MNKKDKKIIHVEMNFKLDINEINVEKIMQWKDLDLCSLKILNSVPSNILDEYCTVLSHIENSMPDEPGNPEVTVTPQEINSEEDVLSLVLLHKDRIVGISRIFIDTEDSQYLYQGQIGIFKGYTNKGFGKFLMGITYSYILSNYKDAKYITVDTHPTNKPMIKLLEGTGFKYTHTENIYDS